MKNNWRVCIGRTGMKHIEVAHRAGTTSTRLSNAVNGRSILEWDELNRVCAVIGCKPADIYGADILSAFYDEASGRERLTSTKPKPKPREDNRVRIDADVMASVKRRADAEGIPVPALINALLAVAVVFFTEDLQ